jgi:exopolysaccharide production protein ExoZ
MLSFACTYIKGINLNWLAKRLEISHSNHSPLRPMEGLRGVAVFLVFLVHYCTLIKPYILRSSLEWSTLNLTHSLGNVGVDLFFVLSGFLIYGTLISKTKTDFPRYFKRRVIRIYPTFLDLFVVYLILSLVFPSESKIPSGFYSGSIFILQNLLLLPGLFDIVPVITVAWSLSYELFYYLFIPFIIAALKLRSWTVKQRFILWIIVSILF